MSQFLLLYHKIISRAYIESGTLEDTAILDKLGNDFTCIRTLEYKQNY